MVVDHTVEVVVANATIALAAPAGRTVARQTKTAQFFTSMCSSARVATTRSGGNSAAHRAAGARARAGANTFQIVERERRTIPANLAGPRFVSRRARPRASSPVPDPPPRRSLARVGAREQRADDAHFADAGADRCRQRDGRRGDEDPRDAGEAAPRARIRTAGVATATNRSTAMAALARDRQEPRRVGRQAAARDGSRPLRAASRAGPAASPPTQVVNGRGVDPGPPSSGIERSRAARPEARASNT